ncbi:hypothetical protein [Streptomyces broussonetiae]|uniref:hypothetical protein n=1 Tax=Streptomyces broussonetiae TaxID=2686304 RepID=UPI0035DB6CF2
MSRHTKRSVRRRRRARPGRLRRAALVLTALVLARLSYGSGGQGASFRTAGLIRTTPPDRRGVGQASRRP